MSFCGAEQSMRYKLSVTTVRFETVYSLFKAMANLSKHIAFLLLILEMCTSPRVRYPVSSHPFESAVVTLESRLTLFETNKSVL